MEKLGKNCLLVDEHNRVCMIFGSYTDTWSMEVPMGYGVIATMNLVLHQTDPDSRQYKLVKNRWGYLDELKSFFNPIFDDYTVLDNNWHGIIEISESDHMRLALSLC